MLSIWNLNTRHHKEDVVRAGNRDFLHLTAAIVGFAARLACYNKGYCIGYSIMGLSSDSVAKILPKILQKPCTFLQRSVEIA